MLLSTLLASKVAVAVGSAAIVLGAGTAAVAAVHVLPGALEQASGTVVGAADDASEPATSSEPADDESPSTGSPSTGSPSTDEPSAESDDPAAAPSPSRRGPDATGPAAFGLCNAYSHGGLPPQSVAYQALARAAGSGTVAEYCATVRHPGGRPAPSASTSAKPHGKKAAASSAAPAHGKSGSHGNPSPGRPSTVPAH
jgi:hypothetical protein